ncbi:30S ribosomal protein S4 [Candidatus Dojkabacteria bacterium]|nr:30S ribosomal protein S4 [Candidatus Dojkabacteria bacterium]
MGKYTGPKCRLCRREGVKLFLRGERCLSPKCAFNRRPVAPGMYPNTTGKISDYGVHLREKQKVKRMYGMGEAQFKRFFGMVSKESNRGFAFLQLLERRLDNIVLKSGWAVSISSARQIVSHGNISVNGKKVDIPSYLVKVGDKITIKKLLWEPSGKAPKWLEVSGTECIIKDYPSREMIDSGIKENLIVEFYSR